MKKKNKIMKCIKRFLEKSKKEKLPLIILIISLIVLLLLMIMLKQKDIGGQEAGLQIEKIASNIRSKYKTRPDYWGLNTDEVIKNELFPADMTFNNGELQGYFGSSVRIGMDEKGTTVMPTVKNFVITYFDLSKAQCVALASNKFNRKFLLGLTHINIISEKSTQTFNWHDTKYSLPISKQNATKFCGKNNKISFSFE